VKKSGLLVTESVGCVSCEEELAVSRSRLVEGAIAESGNGYGSNDSQKYPSVFEALIRKRWLF
jgi:hypothetical protein